MLLTILAPYRFLTLYLCGSACHFPTVHPPHTLSMRCHLPISHRTASSYSAYTVSLAFSHRTASSYSVYAVLLDILAPYSLLILCLCGATCLFHTVQPPHTLSMRCHLPISHRTASSHSVYAVLLAILAPYRFLTLYLCGATCHFHTVQPPHTLSIRCRLPFSHRTASSYSAYAVLLVFAPLQSNISCQNKETHAILCKAMHTSFTSLNSYKTKNSRSPPRAPAVIFILFGIICIPNKSI